MLVADDVCGAAWKRQQVYASVNTIGTHGHALDEKMPIVEIKPFTKEKTEWCRAKSLPEFYEHDNNNNYNKPTDPRDSRGQLADPLSPRPAYTSKMPSPRPIKTAYLDRSDSQQNGSYIYPPKSAPVREMEMFGRTSAWEFQTPFNTPRPGVSFLATPRDRERFTVEDLRAGTPNVCNMQFGTSVSKPEEHFAPKPYLKINGYNFMGPGKYFQLNARNYSLYKAYTVPIEKEEGEKDYIFKRMLSDSRKNSDDIYKLEENRSPNKSPFFNIRNAQRKRGSGMRSLLGTETRTQSSRSSAHGYRIGGIKNSLELLSEFGKPLTIEQQISDDIKSTLGQIRKTNYSCFTPPPSLASHAHFRLTTALPTQGEIMLAEARYANSISTRRSVVRRPPTQASNYSQKTSKSQNRPPSPRASMVTMSQYKSENRDSGIQSPIEGVNPQRTSDIALDKELSSKINIAVTNDSGAKKSRQSRAGSAPTVIEQNIPPRTNSAKTEEDRSQTPQSRKLKISSRGESPVKESNLRPLDTPTLVVQTPVIPEEASDNES